jgi:hypothetical protein
MRTARVLSLGVVMAMLAGVAMAGGLRAENVLTPLPTGFKIGSQGTQGPMTGAEYVPANETVDRWSTMITVQIFHNLPRHDPDGFASNLAVQWKGSCANSDAVKVTSGAENGYPFTVWMYNCPLNTQTGKPENMWMKVIGGADSLYAVQYADRQAMNKALIGPAMGYLRKVVACDTRRPDRPCPKRM